MCLKSLRKRGDTWPIATARAEPSAGPGRGPVRGRTGGLQTGCKPAAFCLRAAHGAGRAR